MRDSTSYDLQIAITTALGFSFFIVFLILGIVIIMIIYAKFIKNSEEDLNHSKARLIEAQNERRKL